MTGFFFLLKFKYNIGQDYSDARVCDFKDGKLIAFYFYTICRKEEKVTTDSVMFKGCMDCNKPTLLYFSVSSKLGYDAY